MLKSKAPQFSKKHRQQIDGVRKANARAEQIGKVSAAHTAHTQAPDLASKKTAWHNLQAAMFPEARIGHPVANVRGGSIRMRGSR